LLVSVLLLCRPQKKENKQEGHGWKDEDGMQGFQLTKLSQNKLNNEKVKQNKEHQKEQKEPKRAYCDRNFKWSCKG